MKDGASAVIISNNKVLLFQRDNIPGIPFPDCWQLPGGGIEEGETPLEGLQRELAEEVTYVPKKIIYLGYFDNILGKNHIFISIVSSEEEEKFKHNPDEGQRIGFFTIEEALNLKLTPGLRWVIENKSREINQLVNEHIIPSPDQLGLTNNSITRNNSYLQLK